MKCKDCKWKRESPHVLTLREPCPACQEKANIHQLAGRVEMDKRERERKIQIKMQTNAYDLAEQELISEGVIEAK